MNANDLLDEFHGWKALVFVLGVLAIVGTLAAMHVVTGEIFVAVLFSVTGYAGGNTVLRRHKGASNTPVEPPKP